MNKTHLLAIFAYPDDETFLPSILLIEKQDMPLKTCIS